MDAQDNLKIIHTVDGASLQNRYGKSVIQIHDIGLISLPTGEIVMADPTLRFEIADFKRKAFQQKVRPGMYPVFAYTAHSDGDCVLAFAEICFTDRPPVTFTAAKTLWDTERSRRRNCGYVVSESTTGFMDGQYFKDACIRSAGEYAAQPGSLRTAVTQRPFLPFQAASTTGTGERTRKARSAAWWLTFLHTFELL